MTNDRRLLISVGCDTYNHLSQLSGAELDAKKIFDTLTSVKYGHYPPNEARLLQSPTLRELLDLLHAAFITQGPFDTVTIFFAGHGGVSKGSYYLCLKDSQQRSMSTTAMPLSLLFTMINEAGPAQCNIIIDACQAGGLTSDIGIFLKPEIIGNAKTTGISIFASSAANEYAGDTLNGGIGTTALLKCLAGEEIIQIHRPYLDLVEAGRAAAQMLEQASSGQTPVVWGLNLFGQSRFSLNPHFSSTGTSSFYSLTNIPANSPAGQTIAHHADSLWQIYYGLPANYNARAIWSVLTEVTNILKNNEEQAASFIIGASRTLSARGADSSDPFRELEILSIGIMALLPLTHTNATADLTVEHLARELLAQLSFELSTIEQHLDFNANLLVTGDPAEFFYLPIRISRLLGWIGSCLLISELTNSPSICDLTMLRRLTSRLLEIYAPSLIPVTDAQTPFIFSFLVGAAKYGWKEECELAMGCLFSRLIENKGKIAIAKIEPERVFEYLLCAHNKNFEESYDLVAQPIELLSSLLLILQLDFFKRTEARPSPLSS